MSSYRTIDIYAAVDYAWLVNDSGVPDALNRLQARMFHGDRTLLRFTLFGTTYDTTAFAVPAGAGLELIVTDAYQVRRSREVMAYADDTEFYAALWPSYSESGGKIACVVDLNTTTLLAALGSVDDEATYHCALVMTPPGAADDTSSSESESSSSESLGTSSSEEQANTGHGKHVTLAQFDIVVSNDLWRVGQAAATAVTLYPYSQQSSSSSSP